MVAAKWTYNTKLQSVADSMITAQASRAEQAQKPRK
jgi:hypothetical protein